MFRGYAPGAYSRGIFRGILRGILRGIFVAY